MELSMLIVERPGLAWKALKALEPLWEKPFQDQDLVASLPEGSLGLLREKEDHLHVGKEPFVPK